MCPGCVIAGEGRVCPECCDTGFPRNIQPMLSRLSGLPSDPENWYCEYQWEGIRTLCYWDGASLSLETRNQRNITMLCPELRDLPRALKAGPIILDGQIVGLDREGRPSLSVLERRMQASPEDAKRLSRKMPLRLFVFDVLFQGDRWLISEPWFRRREILQAAAPEHGALRISPGYRGNAESMLKTARQHGLPGILCKRFDSVYEPGTRSSNWRKVKIVREQNFILGGWTPGRGARAAIASLLLGYHTPEGELAYAGEAGVPASEESLEILRARLKGCSAKESPFGAIPPSKGVRYLSPRLVARVRFQGWTGGRIRDAVYRGLKLDKDPADVVREEEE
jgi:bifunctional non-homologous end joining protein LigD